MCLVDKVCLNLAHNAFSRPPSFADRHNKEDYYRTTLMPSRQHVELSDLV